MSGELTLILAIKFRDNVFDSEIRAKFTSFSLYMANYLAAKAGFHGLMV
jgi:hypothetical protein